MSLYFIKKKIDVSSFSEGNSLELSDRGCDTCDDTSLIGNPNAELAEDSNEGAILNALNDDCWRILLSYVSVHDIVKSESVSKKWCYRMRWYLQGIRICLRSSIYPHQYDNFKPVDTEVKCRTIAALPQCYRPVIMRFGRAIVAADCVDEEILRMLCEFCPDLEEIRVHPKQHLQHSPFDLGIRRKFDKMRRISFTRLAGSFCSSSESPFNDRQISRFLCYKTLEELEIVNNKIVTGECLKLLQSNLKCLQVENCKRLQPDHLLAAVHRLTNLTQLKLNNGSLLIFERVYTLIERMPKLEYLSLERYGFTAHQVERLVNAVCNLRQLRHLSFFDNDSVTDSWLEAVGSCSLELRTVSIGACKGVTAAGVLALCQHAGGTLVALDMSCNDHVTEEDVVRCINYCPKLEMLDVQYCSRLTETLPAYASEAARTRARTRTRAPPRGCPPPLLRIHLPHWLRTRLTYDGVILDFSASNHKCEGY